MIQDYKGKKCIICDNGLNIGLALQLSKWFGEVRYHSPWQSVAVRSNEVSIGDGFKQIIRTNDYWDYIGKDYLWIFPDIYWSSFQRYLRSQGERVWGSGDGERLELFRDEAKQLYSKLGLPVQNYKLVKGMDALREYCKNHKNLWIKIDFTRGDTETFPAVSYNVVEPKLNDLSKSMGEIARIKVFDCEDEIVDAVETGCDLYSVQGQYPDIVSVGCEVKDTCYLTHFKKYKDAPKEVIKSLDALKPYFKESMMTNFIGSEVRVPERGMGYLIDIACRLPSPPGGILIKVLENLADILYFGAEGKLIQPEIKPDHEWGVEIIVNTKDNYASQNWLNIEIPDSIKENFSLKGCTQIDGKIYTVPQYNGWSGIGVIVALAKTFEDAFKRAKECADELQGFYLDIRTGNVDKAKAEIDKLAKKGVTI
jgi:hypothetical protein